MLACDPARGLALFQKAGLIDDQNRALIAKRFQRVLTYNVAQRVGVPLPRPRSACWCHGSGSPAASALTRLARLVA